MNTVKKNETVNGAYRKEKKQHTERSLIRVETRSWYATELFQPLLTHDTPNVSLYQFYYWEAGIRQTTSALNSRLCMALYSIVILRVFICSDIHAIKDGMELYFTSAHFGLYIQFFFLNIRSVIQIQLIIMLIHSFCDDEFWRRWAHTNRIMELITKYFGFFPFVAPM